MHSKKPDLPQWSIRAEFTISPNDNYAQERKSLNNNVQDKSGVQLSYCWRSNENANAIPTSSLPARSNFCKPTEYQRGNITFTSTPPCRIPSSAGASRSNFEVHDSGYGSDLLSPNSFARRTAQGRSNSNNRKCKSTCNIVLCTNACYNIQNSNLHDQVILETTNQVPSLPNTLSSTNDPWCCHPNVLKNKELSGRKLYYDAETSKYPSKTRPSSLYGNVDQVSYKLPKRDVSIQTSDSLQKCSAAALRHGTKPKSKKHDKTISKNCKRNSYKASDNTSSVTENAEKFKASSSTKHSTNKNLEAADHTSDSSKKSRTIHIDVYCTDTELEDSDISDASSDSWENKSTLSSQTVFKSGDLHVKHERANNDGLPFKLKNYPYKKVLNSTTSVDISDSDVDCELSTNYPSKIGSSSTINDFSSSISSFMSWKNNSLLSCANDYGSFNSFNNMSTSSMNNRAVWHKSNSADRSLYNQYFKKCFNDKTNYLSSEKAGTNIFPQNDSQNTKKHFPNQNNLNNITDNLQEDKIKANKPIKSDIYTPSQSDFSIVQPQKEVSSSQGNYPMENPTARLVLDPFSGQYTEQIASRFGQVINLIKKSGHHIGPAKNPQCSCDHCRRHFE